MGEAMTEPILVVYESAEKWRAGCDLSLGRPQVGLVPIPGFPDYLAGDDGLVYTTRGRTPERRWGAVTPRPLSLKPSGGYLKVQMMAGRKRHHLWAHAVICAAFHGPRPEARETSHLNGKRADNEPSNLAWETLGENQRRRLEHGTQIHGERHPWSRLSDERVLEILRARLRERRSAIEIERAFGIDRNTVYKLESGRSRRVLLARFLSESLR